MFQVKAVLASTSRPVFNTVEAENATEAKRIVKSAIEAQGYKVVKATAKKVW